MSLNDPRRNKRHGRMTGRVRLCLHRVRRLGLLSFDPVPRAAWVIRSHRSSRESCQSDMSCHTCSCFRLQTFLPGVFVNAPAAVPDEALDVVEGLGNAEVGDDIEVLDNAKVFALVLHVTLSSVDCRLSNVVYN